MGEQLQKTTQRLLFLLAVAGLSSLSLCVSQAKAAVYWNQHQDIGTANMDGSLPPGHVFSPVWEFPEWHGESCGVAANESYLYLHGGWRITRIGLEGRPVHERVVEGLKGEGCGLAINRSHLFWIEPNLNSIGRADLDGKQADLSFISGLKEPCDVAVNDQSIYWSDGWRIGRARLDGTEVDPFFLSEAFGSCGIVANDRYIYWGSPAGRGIGRVGLDGEDRNDKFISDLGVPGDLALNSTHLFWTDQYRWGSVGVSAIARANLDGSGVEQIWIPGINMQYEFSVAVDSRVTPPPFSLRTPSRPPLIGKLKRNRRTGVAYLEVRAPALGSLSVASPKVGWKVLKGKPPQNGNGLTWHIKIWPGKRGSASRRIRKTLMRTGRAPLILRLTYAEENKEPVSVSHRIELIRLKRRRPDAGNAAKRDRLRSRQTLRDSDLDQDLSFTRFGSRSCEINHATCL